MGQVRVHIGQMRTSMGQVRVHIGNMGQVRVHIGQVRGSMGQVGVHMGQVKQYVWPSMGQVSVLHAAGNSTPGM
eukprot:14620225-Alexandrium_andersonii.AAC.1